MPRRAFRSKLARQPGNCLTSVRLWENASIHSKRKSSLTRGRTKQRTGWPRFRVFGPITASLIAATVADFGVFKRARDFSAWLGLVPRQHSTGGKTRLGRITKTGNRRDKKVAGSGCPIDDFAGTTMEQCRWGVDRPFATTPAFQAGDGRSGEQDSAYRMGIDHARRGLPCKGTRPSCSGPCGMTPFYLVGDGRKPF